MKLSLILCFVLSSGLSLLLHWDVINREIVGAHDWRQSQTMWNVRNFVRYDNNILNPRMGYLNGSNVLRLEFPVMQWAVAQLVRLTGDEVFTARLSLWTIGQATMVAFFLLLCAMRFPPWVAMAGTVLFQFNPLFYFYTVNVLPDLFALMVAVFYVYVSFVYFRERRWWQALIAAILLSLATLAKLPFAMFGIVGTVYILTHIFRDGKTDRRVIGFALVHLVMILPALLWYAWVMPSWNDSPILHGIFGSTNTAAENWRIFYHFVQHYIPFELTSPAVWGLFAVGALLPAVRATDIPYGRYVWALVFATLLFTVLEFNTIGTVHDYYLLPLLPWIYIVVTAGVGRLCQFSVTEPQWLRRVGLSLLAACLISAPVAGYRLAIVKWGPTYGSDYGQLGDVQLYQQDLREVIDDDEMVIVLNDITGQVFTWLIRKRGLVFSNDQVEPLWIDDMRKMGATYLYSNSRTFDQDSTVQTRFDSLVLVRGYVHVYRLK